MKSAIFLSLCALLALIAHVSARGSDLACILRHQGQCQHISAPCRGSYEIGLCPGPGPRRCCVPDPEGDETDDAASEEEEPPSALSAASWGCVLSADPLLNPLLQTFVAFLFISSLCRHYIGG